MNSDHDMNLATASALPFCQTSRRLNLKSFGFFFAPSLLLPMVASIVATAQISFPASVQASDSQDSRSESLPAAQDVCETRRALTIQERDALSTFNSELSWLANYRSGADRNGVTYQQKFSAILLKYEGKFQSEELKDAAGERVLFEQFQQLLFTTTGLENADFKRLTNVYRTVEYFASGTPRELREGIGGMQDRIAKWNQQQLAKVNAASVSNEVKASKTLQSLSQTENVLAALDVVGQTLNYRMIKNNEQLDDKLASYRQYFWSALGGAGVVGTLVVSAPVVSTASATAGVAGVLMAGCSIGAVGGGAAALLQRQYQSYADAWIESANHHTNYACELRRAIENNHETLFHAFREGAVHGGIAGCAFTGAGMVAPQVTVYGVTAAVAIATGADGVMAAKDGYMATKTYLVYRSLIALQKAEQSAEDPAKAAEYLRQAQQYAKNSGAHTLNTILVGIVLTGGPSEIAHAIQHGREAIVALIGKSSDNAAVAVHLLMSVASSTVAGSKTKNSNLGLPALPLDDSAKMKQR